MLSMKSNVDVVPIDITSKPPQVGYCPCPQPGCQTSGDDWPYRKGNVVYELDFDNRISNYVTSESCRCCDGMGFLLQGQRAYELYYVFSHPEAEPEAPYPDPIAMSREVYEDMLKKRAERGALSRPKKAEGCFIASAVYGSYDAPEVLVLRAFRDKSLMSNPLGRILTTIYYAISPSLAKIVKRNKKLQRISHYWLNKIVEKLKSAQ